MTFNSSSVSLRGAFRISSGIIVLPISCTPDLDFQLSSAQMDPLVEAISEKLVQFDPIMIFSCINFPRPMDEGLQRHSLNVALLNGIQAEWLKLTPEDVKIFTLAGLLHDIGKTMIPEEILNAPGVHLRAA